MGDEDKKQQTATEVNEFQMKMSLKHKALVDELLRLKIEEPDKYQELLDASESMYASWLDHEFGVARPPIQRG